MKQYALDRLGEASTWRGVFLCVGAFGLYVFTPAQEDAVIALVIAVFGASHALPDNLRKPGA
jgi:hypothetical protein